MTKSTTDNLRDIPGIGPRLDEQFRAIGLRGVHDLKGKSPERLYRKLCDVQAAPVDRCVLYVLRCAVYYANHIRPDPRKLKWWLWKD